MSVGVPYSAATCNSQQLTFIDEFGVDNTQVTEYNYELTYPTDPTQASQLDNPLSQVSYRLSILKITEYNTSISN